MIFTQLGNKNGQFGTRGGNKGQCDWADVNNLKLYWLWYLVTRRKDVIMVVKNLSMGLINIISTVERKKLMLTSTLGY